MTIYYILGQRARKKMKFEAGQILKFTYNPASIKAGKGVEIDVSEFHDRHKEVFVLQPNWNGKMHGIDLKRLTSAEREVLGAIMDPETKKTKHRLPLVNDVVARMDPIEEIKNPMTFYVKFVKVFLRQKDAYRQYDVSRMSSIVIAKNTNVTGQVINPRPLFGPVKSKENVHGKEQDGEKE